MRQLFRLTKGRVISSFLGFVLILGLSSLLLGHLPWQNETARAGGGDWVNYGTTLGERQPQSGSYQVGQTVSGGWNALKPVSEMEADAQPGNVEVTVNRLTNIFGTDVSKGQAAFTDQDVANYAQAGFPNGGYEHAFSRVGAQVTGDQNSSNWQLTFLWSATTPGYYQIDITPRNNQARSLGWVAVRVEAAAPIASYPTPYTTPYTTPYSYPTPGTSYAYPTPSYSYPYPTPYYYYPTPSYSYPYPYPTPSYSYPTPFYSYPTPAGGPSCPVSSTQARLAKDGDWDTFKTINLGEGIKVGGFHNNDLNNLAHDVTLDLTGPQNFTNIANGSRITPNQTGDYTLRVYHPGYSASQCEAQAVLRILGTTTQTSPGPSPAAQQTQTQTQTVTITQAAAPQVVSGAEVKALPKTGADALLVPPVLLGLWWLGRKIRRKFRVI